MIDFFSDTVTRPSPAMRDCMAKAEVGDEQRKLDPTVNLLQDMVATLLGKEAALFLPSGTMCNQISFAVHCKPGDEVIMDRHAHPYSYEGGGPAAVSGVLIRPVQGLRGIYTPAQITESIRGSEYGHSRSRAISVEQPTNVAGGAIWPLDAMRAVCARAREHHLVTHLDGARLLNAHIATGVPVSDYAATFDSVWIDLSKGLGCPVGAVLAGSRDFIHNAWYVKHRLGGAMRQAGIIAAAGVYALTHNVERLALDHANAKRLAEGLSTIRGIRIEPAKVETNIVFFEVDEAESVAMAIESEGVSFSVYGPALLRAVTHLDVSAADIETALQVVERVMRSR
ncbi:MAG: GntG family PLP-dependent aldolase [Gemmatimonadota bacterium]